MNKSLFFAFCVALVLGIQETALALPSFARQTEQPCGTCHADFPQLTPFGRQFKLNGYTMGAANNTVKNLTDSIVNSIPNSTATTNNSTASTSANNTATTNTAAASAPASNTATTNTAAASAPASNTAATNTATTNTPATNTPATSTPATSTPATSTPATSTPATSTPVTSTPVTSTAATSTPATNTATTNTAVTNTPAASTAVTNTPAASTAASNTATTNTAASNTAASNTAASNTDTTNTEKSFWFPPISIMGVEGFTHTQAPQDNSGTSLKPNDNFLFQSASIFYGGAITDHIGAFAQATYSAPGFGPPPEFKYSWDNTDIRFANTGTIANIPFIYGVTVNNNPTVQDVWNTVPAWGFPFVSSSLAPTPSAAPIINQGFAASVVGAGAYTYINNLVYIEATGYQTLSQSTQKTLGVDPTGTAGLFKNIAPYFRIAAEPNWGNNYLEVGAFGMYANVEPQPWNFDDIGTDSYFDLGVDSQYQYMGSKYTVTLRNSIIMENQDLDASFDNGLASNENNYLGTLNTQASFVYGENFRLPLTVGYFDTWGSEDELLYAGNGNFSPNSSGWITEIAYIPFGMDKAPLWPWLNARIGLQYIWYNEFNGVTDYNSVLDTKASDNNTTFVYIWLAM